MLSTTVIVCHTRIPSAVTSGVGSHALSTGTSIVAMTISAATHETVFHCAHCFTVPKKQSSNSPQ